MAHDRRLAPGRRTSAGGGVVVTDPTHDPIEDVLRNEFQRVFAARLVDAVRALSSRDQELVRAVVFEGQSLDEIAVRHGLSRSSARRAVCRARGRLRDRLLLDGIVRELIAA